MQYTQFFAARGDTGVYLPSATVTVYLAGTSTPAALFNLAGSSIGNPITADATGLVSFAAADGLYDAQVVSADTLYTLPLMKSLQMFDFQKLGAVTTQVGTAYTAALTDASGYIRFNNASPITFTIPPNSSVAFPINTYIEFEQTGAGSLTVAPGAGVTINVRGTKYSLNGQNSVGGVKQVAANVWTFTGDI